MTGPAAPAAVVRQQLPAPPDVVYDEWTDAARLAQWMCPRPARCLHVQADPRIGGTLRFDIEEAGSTFCVSGNYLTLERPHRVAFTWTCSTWPDPTTQTIVTVTIEPDGSEASIMTIEHELLPPALSQQHAHGWTVISTQLQARLRATERSRKPALSGLALPGAGGEAGRGRRSRFSTYTMPAQVDFRLTARRDAEGYGAGSGFGLGPRNCILLLATLGRRSPQRHRPAPAKMAACTR